MMGTTVDMNHPPTSFSARKIYADYPFAHRQHLHAGHCAHIHGHNWKFTFYFSCSQLDSTGFVIDFGELGFIKEFLDECFDHTLVLNASDPMLEHLLSELGDARFDSCSPSGIMLAKILAVDNCSCEGIAAFLLDKLGPQVAARTRDRVWIHSINVSENAKNSATCYNEQ